MNEYFKKTTHAATALLLCVLTALCGACTSEDDDLVFNPEDEVRITGLSVGVSGMTGGTRALSNSNGGTATRAEGTLASNESIVRDADDVRAGMIDIGITDNDNYYESASAQYNATNGTWELDGSDAGGIIISKEKLKEGIDIFIQSLDGRGLDQLDDELWYDHLYMGATVKSSSGNLADATVTCKMGSIAFDANGGMNITLAHNLTLVTAEVVNGLGEGNDVTKVVAKFYNTDNNKTFNKVMHFYDGGDAGGVGIYESFNYFHGLVEFEVYCGESTTPIVVKPPYTAGKDYMEIMDGHVDGPVTGNVNGVGVNAEGKEVGTYHYPFRITLTEGKTEVKLLGGNTLPDWTTGETNDDGSVIRISTAEQLAKIGVDAAYPANGSYVLVNDIDFTNNVNLGSWNAGSWTPIPDFIGKFNGNGYTIRGLNVDVTGDPYTTYAGLFASVGEVSIVSSLTVTPGYVYNLHLDSPSIKVTGGDGHSSTAYIGSIAGTFFGGVIDLCSVSNASLTLTEGTEPPEGRVGGFVGYLYSNNVATTLSRCWASNVNVSSTSIAADADGGIGGYVRGFNAAASVVACHTLGATVTADALAGGVVGYIDDNVTLFGCYAKGANAFYNQSIFNINAGALFSGFDSYTTSSSMSSCYATLGSKDATGNYTAAKVTYNVATGETDPGTNWVGVNGAAGNDNAPTDGDAGYGVLDDDTTGKTFTMLRPKLNGSLEVVTVTLPATTIWTWSEGADKTTVPPVINYAAIQAAVDGGTVVP